MHAHVCAHTYMHMYTHAHAHTHTYTHTQSSFVFSCSTLFYYFQAEVKKYRLRNVHYLKILRVKTLWIRFPLVNRGKFGESPQAMIG